MNNCLQCGTLTKNKKFCARSCAASFNNKISPNRKLERFCAACGIVAVLSDRKFCIDCWETKIRHNRLDEDKVTIHDLQSKKKYQINSRIRMLARSHWKRSSRTFSLRHVGGDDLRLATRGQRAQPKRSALIYPRAAWRRRETR